MGIHELGSRTDWFQLRLNFLKYDLPYLWKEIKWLPREEKEIEKILKLEDVKAGTTLSSYLLRDLEQIA